MIQKKALQRFESCDDGWFNRFFRPATTSCINPGESSSGKTQDIVLSESMGYNNGNEYTHKIKKE